MPVRAANEQVGPYLLSDVLAGLRHALGQVSASERQESAFQFPPTPRNRLTLYPSSGYTLSMTKTKSQQIQTDAQYLIQQITDDGLMTRVVRETVAPDAEVSAIKAGWRQEMRENPERSSDRFSVTQV